MHAPLNGVDTTPVILILAIPSRQIHPTITPHHLVAVCCVICRLSIIHEIYPIHANTPKFTYILILHFTVRPLPCLSAQIRRYPMISYAYEAQRSL